MALRPVFCALSNEFHVLASRILTIEWPSRKRVRQGGGKGNSFLKSLGKLSHDGEASQQAAKIAARNEREAKKGRKRVRQGEGR